jgi:ABC-2 type transport system ATP-binding protein
MNNVQAPSHPGGLPISKAPISKAPISKAPIIEARGLGKRFRRTWALRDCSLTIPAGSIVALVGHNGAGKSTLLNLLVGLIHPTEGTVSVLGGAPAGSPEALDGVGFVAQDAPLYQNMSVADTLRLIGSLNHRWDNERAEARLAELGIPQDRRVGRMSGGQQAQLALTLALARRPRLLVLDEPLAMLDPLARFDFMDTVMTAAATDGLTVVFSSHALAELERVADYLIVLSRGRLQVAGPVAEVVRPSGLEQTVLGYLRDPQLTAAAAGGGADDTGPAVTA